MARKLASIVEIKSCEPIPDTDRLSVATMQGKGWQVVVGRDEFHSGQIAIYLEIDSFCPANDERYEFLRDRCLRKFVSKSGQVVYEGIRIKTIKLRGVVSQGLLMPIDKFPEVTDNIVWNEDKQSDEWIDGSYPIGKDVTDLLHIEHYDEVKERLQPAMGNPISADAMGPFPTGIIPKTDEERIQNLSYWFEQMKQRTWEVTVKADGTSCTVAWCPSYDQVNPNIVCSRNLRLKQTDASGKESVYWQMAKKYKILESARDYFEKTADEIAFQGEIVGPGIQKDRNKENEHTFKCFRIWDISHSRWFHPDNARKICEGYGIPYVEVLHTKFRFFDEIKTMEDALKFAEGKTAEGNEREGVVLKTDDYSEFASFKIVSNKYLLKGED